MQTIHKQIKEKLKYAFSPLYLLVLNESYQHNIIQSMESHFKVVLVTEKFTTCKNMLIRHQAVYQLLANELSNSIHALALHTYTPNEWQERKQITFSSPACLSGFKR